MVHQSSVNKRKCELSPEAASTRVKATSATLANDRMFIRGGLDPYCCSVAAPHSKTVPNLAQHRFFYHTLTKYDRECHYCGRAFSSEQSLQPHIADHEDTSLKMIPCQYAKQHNCDALFAINNTSCYGHRQQHAILEQIIQKYHVELKEKGVLTDNPALAALAAQILAQQSKPTL